MLAVGRRAITAESAEGDEDSHWQVLDRSATRDLLVDSGGGLIDAGRGVGRGLAGGLGLHDMRAFGDGVDDDDSEVQSGCGHTVLNSPDIIGGCGDDELSADSMANPSDKVSRLFYKCDSRF